ncbi:MAG: Ig-like domain-containing protein, partial [Gemmatimonas sp.]
ALAPGEAVVEVSVGQMRRLIEVTVLRRAASSVRIRRVERRMELGDGYALHVDVVDDQGNPAPPGSVQWASSEPASVYVDSMGTVLAIGPGVSRITATVDDASDSIEFESIELPVAAIEVVLEHARVEIGETVGVELRVRDSAGSQRSVTGIRVWSSAPEIASVNVSSMTVHGVSAGTAHIHAACNDATNGVAESSAPLRVAAIAVERVHVVPPTLELEVGTVAAFVVHCLDAKGRELSNANTTVDCAVVSVAAIDSTGILRGVAAGATEMRVRVQNDDGRIVEARVPVRVRKAGLARFAITAPHETLTAGDTLDLAVLAWDTTGQPITDVSPVWRSSDATVATVNTTGRVYARRAGQVVVSAELGGRTERFALPIAAAPLASLTIQAPTKDLTVGVVTRLAVNAIDLSGAHVQPAVRYSADPADAARIHGNELTPLRAGSLTIRAHVTDAAPTSSVTAGVREAIATVDVRAADVREVTANSASNRRPAFSPRTLMVAAGVIVVAVLAWVFRPSSNPDSQVTALAAPPATAAAAAPEPSAKAVASNKAALILDKKSVVVTLGDSAVVSARIDSAGSRISGSAREVKWRSLDESKATVSANGVVHTRHVGLTRLIATRGTLQDTIAVNIAPRERQLTSIKISGAENDFPIGSSQQLSVEFLDAQQLAMTRDLPAVRWSTSDAKTASVSPSGSVTMLAEKTAVISATTGALSTKVTVHGKRAAPTPVVLSPQEEFEATLQTFDRSPSDRAVARTTRSKLDSLESLLAPSEQARVALYTGRAADALDQKDDACRALARALTLRPATNVASQIEESRRKAGCIAAEAPKPEPATNTGKKQSELKAELDSAVVRYTRAFESHDAARVRAAFPSIPKGKLDGYANMFREAREITVTLGAISTASDPLSEVVGSTVEVTVPVRVLFKPKSGNPSDSRTEWKMRLQRTANGWILVALE